MQGNLYFDFVAERLAFSPLCVTKGQRRVQREAGKRRLPLNPDAMLAYGILLERATKLGIARPEFYFFPENSRSDGTRPQKTWRMAWRNITRAAGLRVAKVSQSSASMHHGAARRRCARGRSIEHRWTRLAEDDGTLQPCPHGSKTQSTRRAVARSRSHATDCWNPRTTRELNLC